MLADAAFLSRPLVLLVVAFVAMAALLPVADAAAAPPFERAFSDLWCEEEGGEAQARLADGSKVDCLTAEYAVEFDTGKTGNAYRCTGQAMYYAKVSGRKPLCILIQQEGISDTRFELAVRRIVPPVEVRCMNAAAELFPCPKPPGEQQ